MFFYVIKKNTNWYNYQGANKKTDVNITARESFFRASEGQCRRDWQVKVYTTFTPVLNIYTYVCDVCAFSDDTRCSRLTV